MYVLQHVILSAAKDLSFEIARFFGLRPQNDKKQNFVDWFVLLVIFLSSLQSSSLYAQDQSYDFLIRGAVIFDGEAREPFRGDVGIFGDRITGLGDLKNARAGKIIEAKGMILAPGFIDAHTHSDFNPLIYPKLPNKILQGVTTEITGNCGMSAAPVIGAQRDKIREIWEIGRAHV